MNASLLEVCGGGEANQHAATAFDAESEAICRAIRRALPFLVKRRVSIVARPAVAATERDVLAELASPSFRIGLRCASGACGFIAFDGQALMLLLDGVLGGDGRSPPELRAAGLTPPQNALAARVADAVARAVADPINARFGLTLGPDAAGRDRDGDAIFLVARIDVGDAPAMGTIVVGLPRALVPRRVAAAGFRRRDPRVEAVVSDVDIELVVELGRITMPLGALLAMSAGETLQTDVGVGDAVVVRADGIPLFAGKPTSTGGRFAVRVDRKGA
jgi:flagellar motor switch protein FliM